MASRSRRQRIGFVCAISMLGLTAGATAYAAQAPQAATPDPLAALTTNVAAVFAEGADPRILISEEDHGVTAARTLHLGEEYRDGWTLRAVAAKAVTLSKGGETRTIIVEGSKAAPAAAPAATSGVSNVAATNATPGGGGSSQPGDPRSAALREAVVKGDARQAIAMGGTARDVLAAVMAAPDFPGISPDRIATPETARFANVDGHLGITGTSANGTVRTIIPAEWNDITPPPDAVVISAQPNLKGPPSN